MFIRFALLHMTNPVGVREHHLDGAILKSLDHARPMNSRSPAIRATRAVHLFNDLHDEEGILTDGIIVLQVDNNVLLRSILGGMGERVGGASYVGLRIFGGVDVSANAGRASAAATSIQCLSLRRPFARTEASSEYWLYPPSTAMSTTEERACSTAARNCSRYFGSVDRKNRTPWLNVVHVELLGHMRREIFQLHLLVPRNFAGSLSVPALPSHDKFAKRISRHSNPLPGSVGKLIGGPDEAAHETCDKR